MPRILIAVEGSDADQHTAEVARDLFGADAEYLAINVAEPPTAVPHIASAPYGVVYPYTAWSGSEPATSVDDAVYETAEHARAVAERAGEVTGLDDVEALGDVGDPAEAIVGAADRHDVDVVVVGSHERGWFSRLVNPSVSGAVTSRSHVPVLVVKTAA
jgi:nucleotide-binding universal stress UspA family protein